MKIVLIVVLILSYHCEIISQKFEALSSTVVVRGVAEDNDKMVVFGNGLTWITRSGEVLHSMPLLEGMTASHIKEVVSDGVGGVWVLTAEALGRVDETKLFSVVFKTDEFGEGNGEGLKVMPDGALMVLLKNKIIRVTKDNKYSVYFSSTDKDVDYFKIFEIDNMGNIYVGSFRDIHILDKDKKVTTIKGMLHLSLQSIQVTSEGKIMVLDYNRLFELKNNSLVEILGQSQLSRGVNYFAGVFSSIHDFWLFASRANAFHYKNGIWKNYIPPPGWVTGNYGERMIKTTDGEIWMSLRGHEILRFDGSKWHKVIIGNPLGRKSIMRATLLRNGNLISKENETYFPLAYNNSAFEYIDDLPKSKIYHITLDNSGKYYWSSDNGIYKQSGKDNIKVVSWQKVRPFEVIGDKILHHEYESDVILISNNGKTDSIRNNDHHLGWENIYSVNFYPAFDGSLFITASGRRGLITRYDGKNWQKIIEIQGKMIKGVENIISIDDYSILISSNGSIAKFDATGWKWIHERNDTNLKIYRSHLTKNGTAWIAWSDNKMTIVSSNGDSIDVEVPVERAYMSFNAVVWIEEQVYDLYFENAVYRIDLQKD